MHIGIDVVVVGTGEWGRIEAIDRGIYIVRIDGAGLRHFKRRELRAMTRLEFARHKADQVVLWLIRVLPAQTLTVVVRAAVISLVVIFMPELTMPIM